MLCIVDLGRLSQVALAAVQFVVQSESLPSPSFFLVIELVDVELTFRGELTFDVR